MKMPKQNIRKYSTILIIILLAPIFFYSVVFNSGEMLYSPDSDIVYFTSSYKNFLSSELSSNGEIPFWNPYIYSGHPLLGNPQAGIFYPLNVIFFLVDSDYAFNIIFIINVILAGIFMYLFARSIRINDFGSLVAAISFMFSAVFIERIYAGHLLILDNIVWLPLALYMIEMVFQKKNFMYGFLLSIPISFSIFSGHLQFTLYSLLAMAFYTLFKLVTEKKIMSRSVFAAISVVVGVILGIGIAAVQVLPTLELSSLSTRSIHDYSFATSYSMDPIQTLSFAMPNLFGSPEYWWGFTNFWEFSSYVGVMTLVLAIAGAIFVRGPYKWFFIFLGIFSIMFSLGKNFPLFSAFFDYVPGFDAFRFPARILYLASFSISMLAGLAVASIFSKNMPSNFHMYYKSAGIIGSIMILIGILWSLNPSYVSDLISGPLSEKLQAAALSNPAYIGKASFIIENIQNIVASLSIDFLIFSVLLGASAAVIGYSASSKDKRPVMFMIAAIILIDLWVFSTGYIDTKKPSDIFIRDELVNTVVSDSSGFRILDEMERIPVFIGMRNGIETIGGGFDPLQLKSYNTLLVNNRDCGLYESCYSNDLLAALNVKYVITNRTIESAEFELVESFNRTFDYRSLSYTNDVTNLYLYKNYANRLQLSDLSGTITDVAFSPNKISFISNLDNESTLTVSQNWYPGWKAFSNGEEIPITKDRNGMMSLSLKPGISSVEVVYSPESYRNGLIVTGISGFVLLSLLAVQYRRASS